jgi:probable O-glycosylation ligase (exosortase A-associated)
MRDIIVVSAALWLAFKALRHPWIGVLGWTWLSLMNPHRLAYGFAREVPLAAIVGGTTLLGLVLSKDRRAFPLTGETGLLIVFMVWMCVTLPFSFYFDASTNMWSRVMKIDLMVLVTTAVLFSRKQIETFTWVVVGSIAFYGIKGGLFTIAKGGRHRVWGPDASFIEGNNEIALAIIIIIPLMQFLRGTTENKWIQRGLLWGMILCAMAALGSHSRGALLALGAMTTVLWLRSDKKLVTGIALIVGAAIMIPFMPDEWTERMDTIKTYEKDDSAMGRINAWYMAWNLAKQNFFGGGFSIYENAVFQRYAPVPDDVHAAHSIYFQVLGEHGFVGLFLFLSLFTYTYFRAGRLRSLGARRPETMWVSRLGAMCQVSLAGYAVGGAFLSLSYFDLPYNIIVLVVVAHRWLKSCEWESESVPGTGAAPLAAADVGRPPIQPSRGT